MKTSFLMLLCPIVLTLACNEKKEFGADVAASQLPASQTPAQAGDSVPSTPEVNAPTTPAQNPIVEPNKPEIPKCEVGESEITQVTLLTTGVDLTIENQLIQYEVSVLSCKDGSIVPINEQSIAFDLDLQYQGDLPAIAYTILDSESRELIVEGDLLTVKGSDLFGKTGRGYRHWKTEDVSFSSRLEKVILEINLKQARLLTYIPGQTSGDSYLRMGKAAAVKQTIDIIDQ